MPRASKKAPSADTSHQAGPKPTLVLLVRHGQTPTTGASLPGRAPGLREALQEVRGCPDRASGEKQLSAWRARACRSRLESFRRLARTIKEHREGMPACFPDRVTPAAMEAVNGLIQTACRRARGYRNFGNLRAICCWMAGRLDLKVPQMSAHIK